MAKKSKNSELDLNGDGKFDKEDKKLAGKVLATKIEKSEEEEGSTVVAEEKSKEEEEEEKIVEKVPVEGQVALVDISRTYREGDVVPRAQIDKWKSMGLKLDRWF